MARPILDRFVVVLNEPQDVVNIAGTARAMLNMGLRRLRLVRPAEFDAYRITGIAHGSEALIEAAEFHESLEEALADAAHVVGTTARRRAPRYVWQHPRAAAPELVALAGVSEGPIALVFGREDKGLSNEQLDLCDRVLTVPVDPEYPSLNLAQAVLLITYEIAQAVPEGVALPRPRRYAPLAHPEELRRLFEDWDRALELIEFYKSRNPQSILRTLRAIVRRARLDAREAKLVRAIAIEIRKYLERRAG